MSTNSTSEPRELTETPDLNGAYPRLDEAGIAALAPLGRRRWVQPEEVLFREGDRDCQFFVVLAGMVASVEGYGTAEENVISVHGRGRFLGELSLLTGEAPTTPPSRRRKARSWPCRPAGSGNSSPATRASATSSCGLT